MFQGKAITGEVNGQIRAMVMRDRTGKKKINPKEH